MSNYKYSARRVIDARYALSVAQDAEAKLRGQILSAEKEVERLKRLLQLCRANLRVAFATYDIERRKPARSER